MIYFYYPPTVLGFLMFLAIFLYLLIAARGTKEDRQARRQERLEANRAKIQENTQAIGEDLQKIPTVVKIVIGLTVLFLAFVFLVLWFF